MTGWLVTNARLVNEGSITETDIRIRRGRIETLGDGLRARRGETVLDARGRYVMPGMIDDQVHFREPGLTGKGDIASESRAAVAGGITSYMEMPNTAPPTVDRGRLAEKFSRAAGRSVANYSFYFGASNDNLDEIRALDPGQACGIKVFMGASTGNMLVDDPQTLDNIFRDARLIIATHCEDTPTIEANLAAARSRYGSGIPPAAHAEIRSREACLKSTRLAIELARRHDARLHVLHLTTAEEMELFESGPIETKRITGEACVHHLYFTDADYAALGNLIKCNPSIKTDADRLALCRALAEDRLDIIATDHAPHLPAEKGSDYDRAAAGLPLVQYAVPAAWSLVAGGHLDVTRLVEKLSHNPALRFEVSERGFAREGYYADLVLVDPTAPTVVDEQPMLSRCGWTPFAGRSLPARVEATWVNGELVWHDGLLTGVVPGSVLEFTRES